MQNVAVLEPAEIAALKDIAKLRPLFEKLLARMEEKERSDENPWVNSTEFQKLNDISNATFWRWLKEGKIESHPAMTNDKIKLYRRVMGGGG